MRQQSYPLGIAIKNGGGRKLKQDRHIRSERAKRRAFKAQSEKLIRRFERTHGIAVDPDTFLELSEKDPLLAQLGKQLVEMRSRFLGV